MPERRTAMNFDQDVVHTKLDGEGVLVNLKTRYYYSLNETGTRIWELANDGKDLNAITKVLVDEFEIEEEQAAQDASELLSELKRERLLA